MHSSTMSSLTSLQPCYHFSLDEIKSSTNDFDDELVIGQGGFGKVYKGHICINETSHVVAIKRLDSFSTQGELEFRAEIEMLAKLRHRHLVSLIGYCNDNKEMILVYEYMPHGALHDHLHKDDTHLSWMQRLKVAIGAARGIDYLHKGGDTKHGIIHRDVKSSNILLDENWEAMISDFGLSKIIPVDHSFYASIKGTFGYLDPEYLFTNKLTRATDVYAFGVLLFELLSGRLPVDIRYGEEQCSLVRWAKQFVKERRLEQMVDSKIKGTISSKCLRRFSTKKEIVGQDLKVFTYEELRCATRGFAKDTYLGAQSYGEVYQGWVDKTTYSPSKYKTGTPVVIKSLSWNRTVDIEKLKLELEMLKEFSHPNLVKLIGYCLLDKELFLVNEYMHNGNFEEHLLSGAIARLPLATKVKIALGIARGIVFLQNTRDDIHVYSHWGGTISMFRLDRHNVLLDEDFTVKLSDYEVTKLLHGHYSYNIRDDSGLVYGDYYPGFKPFQLQSNLDGFTLVLMEVLTGTQISYENDQKIDELLVQYGKMPLRRIARLFFEMCNEVDSESKMLTLLEEYDIYICWNGAGRSPPQLKIYI
ncbi:probable receptor-like protein kinase isoform X1 [Tanacetum coccineum]|uniref:Probable receptor-like protein kinase isoform X1 n=1 Tax=Tanacetum coccineum TaxID=301880 RepID=A0ABQ5HDT6_9ASTR